MKKLEGCWYTFGIGSDGAKAGMVDFRIQYAQLLALHIAAGNQEAHNLLTGTLKTASEVLQAQQTIKANRDSGGGQTDDSFQAERTQEIHKASLAVADDEIKAQQAVVDAYQSQARAAVAVMDLSKAMKGNKGTEEDHAAASLRAAAESQLRMGEMAISSDRAVAKSQLDIHRASVEER